jgi:serine phosphatase RsbU (regulator of sigma subunit)/transposase-like protein
MNQDPTVCLLCAEPRVPEGTTRKARFYCNTCGKEWILERRKSTRFSGLVHARDSSDRIAVLLDSLALFNSTLKLEELTKSFIDFVFHKFGKRNIALLLMDLEREKIALAGYRSNSSKIESKIRNLDPDFELSYGVLIRSMSDLRSIYYPIEPESHPFYNFYANLTGTKFQLVVPIVYGPNPLGLVTMDFYDENQEEHREDQELLELLVAQFAVAVRNANLYEKSKQQSNYFQNLHLAALTLSKLYLDNHSEMHRMILLTAASFSDSEIHTLYLQNSAQEKSEILIWNRLTQDSGVHIQTKEWTREDSEIFQTKDSQFSPKEILLYFKTEDETEYLLCLKKVNNRFSKHDFEVLNAFIALSKITLENAAMYSRIRDQSKMEREMEIAKEIQKNLLPKFLPEFDDFDFTGLMESAIGVGGDYFDFILAPDRSELIACIGDVSGKGVGAGMVMATVRTILHSLVRKKPKPFEILSDINTYLYFNYRDSNTVRFMTMTLLSWKPGTNQIGFSGAGQGNILHFRRKLGKVDEISTNGIILGIQPKIQAWENFNTVEMDPGDVLLLYTDGVNEAKNPQGEQFEEERIIRFLEKFSDLPAKEILEKIYSEIMLFTGKTGQDDDITMICIKRKSE